MIDKTLYSGSDVLINKFDIRDSDTARAVEYKFASVRELEIAVTPIQGKFDADHLKAIHKHLFQDVYDWAGQTREIDLAKRNLNTGTVNKFTPPHDIDQKAKEFNQFIASKKELKGLTKVEFVKEFTEVHSKLNELHPFREGNGRSTRIFMEQLAKHAGFELDLTKIDKERWHEASHRSITQHHSRDPGVQLVGNKMDMRQIFHEALTPTREHAFAVESQEVATKLYPELKSHYSNLKTVDMLLNSVPSNVKTQLVAMQEGNITKTLKAETQKEAEAALMNRVRDERKQLPVARITEQNQERVVSHALVEVLKGKGYSPETIAKAVEQAGQKMDLLKSQGKALPSVGTKKKEPEKTVRQTAELSRER